MQNTAVLKVKNFLMENLAKPNLTLEERRALLSRLHRSFHTKQDISITEKTIKGISTFWVAAPHVSKDKVILFLHGGGFRATTSEDYFDLLGKLSQASGIPILSVDYRLAPENPFPAALEDSLAVYDWLQTAAHYPPSNMIVAGMSSGGNLTLAMLIHLRDFSLKLPVAAICFSPMTDFTLTAKSLDVNNGKDWYTKEVLYKIREDYVTNQDIKNPLISPLYADLHGLPPILIQVGDNELLLDDAINFVQKAENSGVAIKLEQWRGMIHNWSLFNRDIPEGLDAIKSAAAYAKTYLR